MCFDTALMVQLVHLLHCFTVYVLQPDEQQQHETREVKVKGKEEMKEWKNEKEKS